MIKLLKNHYHVKYHGVYQHAKKLFVFDLALLFTAIVMFSGSLFLFFWKPSLVDLIDLSVSLGGNRIKSGESVRLTVNFENRSKQKLTDVSLSIKLPEGFIIDRNKTPSEIFSEHSIFQRIQEIPAGGSGQTEVYGKLWLEPKKEKRITATLSYRPDNKTSREQKFSALIANLSDSILTSELVFPASVFAKSPTTFIYIIKNNGDQEIDNISISNNWNTTIIKEKDSRNLSLPPHGSKKIEGQITTPAQSGDYTLTFTPQVLVNNHLISQSSASQSFKVLTPQVEASVHLAEGVAYGEPGQIIPLRVRWENKSGFKLEGASLHLATNLAGVVDWKKTAVENNAKLETNGIFFDGNARTSLSSGAANNPDTFMVKLYLLRTFTIGSSIEKANLEVYPIIKAGAGEISEQQFSYKGSSAGFALATEIKFVSAEARYYTDEGDQLGRGNLPPKVNKNTKYWVFIKINNTTNAVDDASFRTSLPPGVEFTGKQSTTIGPQLKYNSLDGSISWQYYNLPANSQTGLYFEVSVTPSDSQVGQNIKLTNNLSFSATDAATGKKFNLTHSPINNILNRNDDGFRLGSKVLP